MWEYPSSKLELAEGLLLPDAAAAALSIAAVVVPVPMAEATLTTTVLQELLHWEPSAGPDTQLDDAVSTSARIRLVRPGRVGDGIGHSPSLVVIVVVVDDVVIVVVELLVDEMAAAALARESSPEPLEAGPASGSSSLCTRSLTIPEVVLDEVLEISEIRWSARELRVVRLSLLRVG